MFFEIEQKLCANVPEETAFKCPASKIYCCLHNALQFRS